MANFVVGDTAVRRVESPAGTLTYDFGSVVKVVIVAAPASRTITVLLSGAEVAIDQALLLTMDEARAEIDP